MSRIHAEPPLQAAAVRGRASRVRALLAAGADPNSLDNYDSTALRMAVMANHPDCAIILIEAGAKPDWGPPEELSTLAIACMVFDGSDAWINAMVAFRDAGAVFAPHAAILPEHYACLSSIFGPVR